MRVNDEKLYNLLLSFQEKYLKYETRYETLKKLQKIYTNAHVDSLAENYYELMCISREAYLDLFNISELTDEEYQKIIVRDEEDVKVSDISACLLDYQNYIVR